jgi:antitoxin ParD1/3/4
MLSIECHYQYLPYYANHGIVLLMATKQITRNIALTPRLDRLVRTKVASGRYQSASEVVREGLRLLEERDLIRKHDLTNLRRAVEAGWQASENGPLYDGPAVFAEIQRQSDARRRKALR